VQFEVYGVHHLAKSLRAIEKTQKKITDHLRNPIQVTTEDWKAHDERMKEEEACGRTGTGRRPHAPCASLTPVRTPRPGSGAAGAALNKYRNSNHGP